MVVQAPELPEYAISSDFIGQSKEEKNVTFILRHIDLPTITVSRAYVEPGTNFYSTKFLKPKHASHRFNNLFKEKKARAHLFFTSAGVITPPPHQ